MKIKRLSIIGGLSVLILASFWYVSRDDGKVPVGINGVNHMGYRYSIREYYVNGHYSSNIGREGGGGSYNCCMVLPSVWKPGMKVDLRWEVYDHDENRVSRYRATVPVEKYDAPGDAVVHVFRDSTARFVSSEWGVLSPNHPVAWGESDGGRLASKGQIVSELFTQEELQKEQDRSTSGRGWR